MIRLLRKIFGVVLRVRSLHVGYFRCRDCAQLHPSIEEMGLFINGNPIRQICQPCADYWHNIQ